MRISDWSSDVCSSDLDAATGRHGDLPRGGRRHPMGGGPCRCGQHPAGGWMTRIASLCSGDLPLPPLAGTAEAGGSLADFIWFRTGGAAEWRVRIRDVAELGRKRVGSGTCVEVCVDLGVLSSMHK